MKVLTRARGALAALFGAQPSASSTTTLQSPAPWLLDLVGRRSAAGEVVTPEKALRIPAFLAGSRIVAGDVAKVKKRLVKRRPKRGFDVDYGHPVDEILHHQFNPILSAFSGWRLLVHRAIGWWGGPAEIVRNPRGEVVELWPIHPSRLTPELQDDGRTLEYVWRMPGFDEIRLDASDVFVLTGLGDGVRGYSPADINSDSLGIALAAQKHTGAFFGEGLAKRLVATASEALKPEQVRQLQRIIQKARGEGQEPGSRKIPFIPGDVKLTDLGLSPKEAQYIESLEYFGVGDVSRLTGCPTWLLGSEKQAKGWSSYAMQYQAYIDSTLVHWIEEIRGEARLKLLSKDERVTHKVIEDFNTLLKADVGARGDYIQKQFRNGGLTRNEIRELNNKNPDEEDPTADAFFLTQDLILARDIGKSAEPRPGGGTPNPGDTKDDPAEDRDQDEADPEDDEAVAGRIAVAIDALEPMVSDVAARLSRRAVIQVRRALKKHAADTDAFCAWSREASARVVQEAREAFRPITVAAARIVDSIDASAPGPGFGADLHLQISLGPDFEEESWAMDTVDHVMARLKQWAGLEIPDA